MGLLGFFALLRQFVWRHARLHPLIATLNVASIALGVAVYLAVQVANHSATRAFGASIDLVSGKTQLEVRGVTGSLEDSLLPLVTTHQGVAAATPVLQAYVTLRDFPGEYLRVLGIDVFSNAPFQTADLGSGGLLASGAGITWLANPAQVFLTSDYAAEHELESGDQLWVQHDGKSSSLEVWVIDTEEGLDSATSDRFAIMDIGWLQEFTGTAGKVESIHVLLDEGQEIEPMRESLQAALPGDIVVTTPAQRGQQIDTMVAGFRLNLTALSMVSILVGVFLIYNTVAASVVRRRSEIGTLRATGGSRGLVRSLFLSEAAIYAALGSLVGVPLGLLLSQALVTQVSSVISVHYILVHVAAAFSDPVHVARAIGYGMLASLAGAWIPASEAASIPPASALRPRGEIQQAEAWRWRTPAGLGCLLLCAIVSWATLHSHLPPVWSFVSCLLLMVGFSLLISSAMRLLAIPLRYLVQGRAELALAVDNLTRSLHRNSMTAAALMASIAMMVGVTIMVRSFRNTVDLWMQRTVVADIFVSPAANESLGMVAFLDPAIREAAMKVPGVLSTDTYREVPIETNDAVFSLSVIDGPPRNNLPLVRPSAEVEAGSWQAIGKALINEPYARRFGVKEGDTVQLPAPGGPVEFEVLGIHYDYADNQGKIAISQANFDAHWDDSRYHSLALYLAPGTDPKDIMEPLQKQFSTAGELSIYANSQLREKVFDIFDQTFAVTYVLRTIAVAVAIAGILLTLCTLVRERTREIAVLRAIGASRGQVGLSYLAEAGCIGLCSALVGIACGLCLSLVLTYVVNLAFFGWTVNFHLPWFELVPIPFWATAVAALAGLIPARLAARLDPAPALREL